MAHALEPGSSAYSVALTFDDGPDPRWTPDLLDVLDRSASRATFFVIAARAVRAHGLMQRMLSAGHSIGLHCDAHVRHSERDLKWVEADTDRALAALADVGVTPRLWRTPWGVTAPWTADVADARNLRLINWTIDTHDWRGDDAQAMFVRARDRLKPGAIVLAHDGIGPGARRDGAEQTIGFTALLAEFASRHQIALTALS